jgi:hypothetical protein
MRDAHVLPFIGLPRADLREIERAAAARAATSNPITVLAALTNEDLAPVWKLSREENRLLNWLQQQSERPSLDRLKDVATSKCGHEYAIELAALFGPSRELDQIRSWELPVFPVCGHDLIARGIIPGPAFGDTLARLEQAWKASGYNLSKDELLNETVPAITL